jgi:hypothetical protein
MRAVVAPHGRAAHPAERETDSWHIGSILTLLVAVHAVALAYWLYLLFISRERRKRARERGEDAPPAWRTPKDIMREHQKAQLGKL